jgi:TonB family protein
MLFALLLAQAAAQAPAAAAAQAPPAPPKVVGVSLLPPSAKDPTHPPIAIAPGSWFSADSYPPEAARKGIEGSVRFEVEVDATGKPTACRIVKSSKSDILDQTTCQIVMANARFIPGALNGKPVAGTFQTNASWRLEGHGPTNGYVAAIIDFSKDPKHPSCSLVSNGFVGGPTCDQALQTFGQGGVQKKLKQVVALMSLTTGNGQPYRGEAAWGRRISFVAINLYPPKNAKPGPVTPACEIVAEEGADAGFNPCAPYAAAGKVTDADKNNPDMAHVEQSVFVIPQDSAATPDKCKHGETAAEASGCI